MWLWLGPMEEFRKVAVLSAAVGEKETTWSVANGAVVPMPTLVFSGASLTPAMLPSTSELLWSTRAREPIAVALVRFDPTLESVPIAVFLLPDLLPMPARYPKKAFCPPVSVFEPALSPKNEFWILVVLNSPAEEPKK